MRLTWTIAREEWFVRAFHVYAAEGLIAARFSRGDAARAFARRIGGAVSRFY